MNTQLDALDKLLSEDKLDSLNRMLDIIQSADKLGLLDVIRGVLDDEEYVGKILGAIVNDRTMEIATNWNKLLDLVEMFTDADTISNLKYLLGFFGDLKNTGILDPIRGMLTDEEYLGKILGAIVNDRTMEIATNWNKLLDLVEMFTDADTISNLKYLLGFFGDLKNTGILDPIRGMLTDEEYLGKILGAMVNDRTLGLIEKWDNLIDLVDVVADEDTVNAVKNVLDILKDLSKNGVLDPIKGLIKDEESLGKIIGGVVNDFTLNLMTYWNQITKDLATIDLNNFKYFTYLISATGEALKTENVKPVKGMWAILGELKDPDVQRGMGVAFAALRQIGKLYDPNNGKIALQTKQ
ncbi:DUF1641 domain-containing protein [Sulfuracidifex metallicus]|uniref:DUF1641 domain-containing protein n=1 Tax=Sulfuracidifex metallicus DSM 6482 = JCM 9184 TaxID=523847 RepID=A0A6A9QWA8_SULME|nr:DUF1641 domain-containing protein [Sulfuracidifex metallicus]MUN29322.1 DUF1641 domain-containing protein [Sulfuracidifex metallicus DSM 6482 = JCM 9184]